jgi:hypothetical protein
MSAGGPVKLDADPPATPDLFYLRFVELKGQFKRYNKAGFL